MKQGVVGVHRMRRNSWSCDLCANKFSSFIRVWLRPRQPFIHPKTVKTGKTRHYKLTLIYFPKKWVIHVLFPNKNRCDVWNKELMVLASPLIMWFASFTSPQSKQLSFWHGKIWSPLQKIREVCDICNESSSNHLVTMLTNACFWIGKYKEFLNKYSVIFVVFYDLDNSGV